MQISLSFLKPRQYSVFSQKASPASAGNWTTRGYANSRTGQVADWTTRGLACRQRGKLSTQSRRWHPRVVQYATCPVRELSSPRVGQSARCPVRESSTPRVGNPRVGVSASCPVTLLHGGFAPRHSVGALPMVRTGARPPDIQSCPPTSNDLSLPTGAWKRKGREGNWTTRGYANSRIANSRTGHLAD